jgi:hypothetical protein
METSREVSKVSDKKIEQFWRPATADDVARVMRGETVEARFRDELDEEWIRGSDSFLGGFAISHREVITWISKTTIRWQQCQVYDPPGILKNKPDPGEGWRLLGKFPDEPITGTDDYWSTAKAKWMPIVKLTTNKQPEKTWFRRRIETNNPEIPDSSNSSETPNSCRSRDTIPSGWRVLGKDEERLASDAYWSLGAKDWIVIGDDRVGVANELPKWHAIRQVDHQADYTLLVGFTYPLPNGQTIRVTAKGFEVE